MTYSVYRAYGLHSIRHETEEQFAVTKKFNKMYKVDDKFWKNTSSRYPVFAWEDDGLKESEV